MSTAPIEVPRLVRLKAQSEGEAGAAWLAGLGQIVHDLADEWELTVGRPMAGGTAAFVAEAMMADGREAILKIAIPGRADGDSERRVLLAANGRGYAMLYRHDQAHGALLLERLGPQLGQLGLPVDAQIEAVCATLKEAWAPLPDGIRFMTGAEKATSLAVYVEQVWRELDRPCTEQAVETALRFADNRRRDFEPNRAVLAHGDAHPWNLLLVPGSDPQRFKFVDPDGFFVEPAYDLGIIMREWADDLLAGDPVALGHARCRKLAALTGVEPEPIWQWGFMNRVATGLFCLNLGMDGARDILTVADAWAASETA